MAELGSPTLRALYEGFGWDLDGLLAMTEDVIAQTERLHERELDRALRSRVGVPLDSAGPQDVSRLWRAPEFDTAFAADRALPALRGTLEAWASISTASRTSSSTSTAGRARSPAPSARRSSCPTA